MQNLHKKVRSKKLSSRVDLTAMVSVSFLLIIFFMLVGELSKPKVLVYDTGRDRGCCDCPPPHYGENRSITVMLGENNKLIYYMGILSSPIIAPKEIKYGKEGIRQELLKRNKSMLEYSAALGKPGRGITIIIKPSKKSNFKNLVDILDEMAIVNIQTYAIIPEFTPQESELLASN
ncbi:biopolymer transporter ExbD [Flavobacterium sp. WLB]|uniref:ExbD/TolR family protein n=1 Tax=unclassified Flavobacterium TaxID=196869 RepID=UPI0006ABD248|nr:MULTISPECIES: biopolymer transporter ExbD [unclassified Flavobacterium]KOP36016.1 biopolymer transporter ExbD [Flavobacterium sp. VMW]OWU89663.1 biopolymer transporter ExbD [Flavobacterium sp. NLM]PUU69779.1 biopolymer transporter ExbD [Flavobacterium sp. WLB]